MSLKLTLQDGMRTALQPGDLIEWTGWNGGWRVRRFKDDAELVILFRDDAAATFQMTVKINHLRTADHDLIVTLFAAMAGLDIEQVDSCVWRCIAPT